MIFCRLSVVENISIRIGLILAVLLDSLDYVTCSNIVLLPFAYRSHVSEITSIGSGLQSRGHSVFLVLPESYPHLDELKDRFQLVLYTVKYPDVYSKADETNSWKSWVEIAMSVSPIEELRMSVEGFIEFCTNPLEDEDLPVKLGKLHLDLAIVDGFSGTRCLYLIMYKLGIPYISLATQYEPWLLRNPALPSFVPFPLAGIFTEKMTFFERIRNLVTLVDWTAWTGMPFTEDSFLRKYLPENTEVTYSWLAARSLLWLVDSDVVIDYVRPTMANEINVAGLLTRPSRPLPPDLETFANDSSEGFIVASFGTSGVLEDEKSFEKFVSAFARLKQRVFWKFSNEIPANWTSGIPPNVMLMKWLPQNDLLGHRNCKLFVTHCGTNSQFEALYHAVPMLGIPVFADQPYWARVMEYRGNGRFFDLSVFTSDLLFDSIIEVLSNTSYLENIQRGSAIFKDRPQTPQERAVWWVEHVLRHGGKHLHSFALDMPWYEYLMLDMLLVLVILPVVVATSLLTCCAVWLLSQRRSPKLKLKNI